MKMNSLLNEICRGTWMLDSQYVLGAGEMVSRIMAGELNVMAQKPTSSDPALIEAAVVDVYGSDGIKTGRGFDGEIRSGSTAVVSMIGPVIKYGDFCTYGADELVSFMYKASRNPNIDEIILYIDSPGGSVNAIAPFIQFGLNNKKPVKVIVDQACSLGYWAACAMGGSIYMDNTISGTVGSIGVQLSFMDAIPYHEKMGYKYHRITPDESSEKNLIFEEVLAGNYDRIKKEMLSPMAVQFQDAVRAARPQLVEEKGVLNGKTYFYADAMRLGLIDGIASIEQMVQNKKERYEIEELRR